MPDDERDGYDLGRLLALADAVFAIAMTLLVVTLLDEVDVGTDDRADALGDAVPSMLALLPAQRIDWRRLR